MILDQSVMYRYWLLISKITTSDDNMKGKYIFVFKAFRGAFKQPLEWKARVLSLFTVHSIID